MIYGTGCAEAAPRIEHAQVLRPDLVDRMAEMGVVACIQPSFAVSDAPTAWDALGDRMATAYRWSMLLEAGVPVISGSDFPIEDLSPLVGLGRLVTGADDSGRPVAPRLPLADALAVMTDASAGVTVLSDDPHSVDPLDLAALEVVQTVPSAS
jgi:predicted amidohydrolase YtcJ